jgi:hypothetical protein
VDLSSISSSSLEQSVFQAQLKRATSCNEAMQASLKRLRTESQNTIEDLKDKNEVSSSVFRDVNRLFFFLVVRTLSSRMPNQNLRIGVSVR